MLFAKLDQQLKQENKILSEELNIWNQHKCDTASPETSKYSQALIRAETDPAPQDKVSKKAKKWKTIQSRLKVEKKSTKFSNIL